MDSNNYKVPKKQPINYGPKIKPKTSSAKPIYKPAATSQNHRPIARQPASSQSLNRGAPTKPAPIIQKSGPKPQQLQQLQPIVKPEVVYTAPIKPKKHRKSKKIIKKFIIIMAVIVLLGLLVIGGYFGYKKYQESNRQPEANNSSNSKTVNGAQGVQNSSVNPILSADYIVYGLKAGSLFATDKSDYQKDTNSPTVKVIAKSTYPNDKREITISQQKVDTSFTKDPQALKKMADNIGPNTSITTNNSVSYIITGNATGITALGATLISVRTSASLAMTEWQQIFDSLEPVQI